MDDTSVHFVDEAEVRAAADLLFDRQRRVIGAVMPWAEIEHVGGTSVPGCLTKGDLDIAVRVPRERFAEAEALLAKQYDRNEGNGEPGEFASFKNDAATPPLGVQLVVIGSGSDFFVRQRDALRADPRLRAALNELKRTFEGRPMDEYRAAKGRFFEEIATARGTGSAP